MGESRSKPDGSRCPAWSGEVLDSLLEGCQIISPEGRYLYVNDAAARHGRTSRDLLVGRTMGEVYPGIERTAMHDLLMRCMRCRTAEVMENRFLFPDGSAGWFELRFEPVPEGVFILSIDVTERKRAEEEQQAVLFETLRTINAASTLEDVLKPLLARLREWSGCEAVGIRLRQGPDYPYYETSGFPEEFVRLENTLCNYDASGAPELDAGGLPVVECMCGNVLQGRYDPSKSFFTLDGSFWSNGTTELLATTTEADRQARTRNRCNGSGYESVALIPIRSAEETFGLIQLNDRRKNVFTREGIALFRRVADSIAVFLAKKVADSRIAHLNAVLRGIRNVNQLITREKDPDRLIRDACGMLVEARCFDSVVVGLTDPAGSRVVAHASAGREPLGILRMLADGELPACAAEAVRSRRADLRPGGPGACAGCPGSDGDLRRDTLTVPLVHGARLYGFMTTRLPEGMGGDPEERGLLEEVAGDVAFALRGIETESERCRSEEELSVVNEQLRQSQKLEALGRLAGGVAHDFNNILMAQMGYCDLLKESLAGDATDLESDLAQIRACADRAANLTRQLLAFGRRQPLRREVLDLDAIVTGAEGMLRRLLDERIRFEVIPGAEAGRVNADPGQLEQVLMNLVVNARDAMPEGGSLILETSGAELDADYAAVHADVLPGSYLLVCVTDTGCGMDEEVRTRIFEPFFTTKGPGLGTGLGLSTVYGIVRQSGGHVWCYSEPGRGTTFKVYLPRVSEEPAAKETEPPRPSPGGGELVLVVEDDEDLRDIVERMLESLGYRTASAPDGDAALHAVTAGGVRPDLVIADLVTPGTSGAVLAERLGEIRPGLRVLFTSGYTDASAGRFGRLPDGAPFLQKPFSITQLASILREVLASR